MSWSQRRPVMVRKLYKVFKYTIKFHYFHYILQNYSNNMQHFLKSLEELLSFLCRVTAHGCLFSIAFLCQLYHKCASAAHLWYFLLLTSKSMTCRFSTSAISRPLLYSSWANWATVSVWGSLSLLPYRISFMDTKHLDTSSEACRTENYRWGRMEAKKASFRGITCRNYH